MKHLFMKPTTKIIMALILLITTAYSCGGGLTEEERWNPELPPITQTGANTFGCKINGKIMIPRDSRYGHPGGGGIPTGVTYSRSRPPLTGTNYDYIEAIDRYTSRGGITFKLPNIQTLGVGEYLVKTVKGAFSTSLDGSFPDTNIVYMGAAYNGNSPTAGYSSIEGTGKIIITRYDNDIISGTFYCKLKNDIYPDDIIEVTEGRFDFTKSTINTTKFR